MNISYKTRAIAEGGLMAVFTAVLAAAGLYIPLVQFVVFFVWTIPSVLVIVRHGLVTGLVSLTAATLLIFMLTGPVNAIMAAIQIGSLAVVYGYAFRHGWKAGKTLFSGALIMVASTLILYYAIFIITGINNLNIGALLQESLEPTIQMYKDFGLINPENGVNEETIRQIMQGYFQAFTFFFPGMFALSGVVSAFLTFFASKKILRRFQVEVADLPAFRYWRLPWWIVWGLIAGLFFYVAGMQWNNGLLNKIGSNVVLVYVLISSILGFATARFFILKFLGKDAIYRVLLPVLIFFLWPYSVVFLAIVGLLDLVFNYRRLPGKSEVRR